MIEPVSALGSNHTSLRMWAAFSSRGKGELHSESEPVAPAPVAPSATLESVPKPAALEMPSGSHVMTCKCTLCSNTGMESIASPLGGVKIVEVNLTGTLSSEEKEMVKKLQERDVQVRRHEQAHLATAGPHALGGPQYTFQVGPDGRRYAIGGEVQVDMSPVSGDAEATLRKAQQLQQAALAPVDPSGADRNVAMAAAHMAQDARQKIVEERREAAEEIREEKAAEKSKETETGEGAVEPSQATGNSLPPAHTNPAEADSPPLVSQNEQTENESSHNLDFYA